MLRQWYQRLTDLVTHGGCHGLALLQDIPLPVLEHSLKLRLKFLVARHRAQVSLRQHLLNLPLRCLLGTGLRLGERQPLKFERLLDLLHESLLSCFLSSCNIRTRGSCQSMCLLILRTIVLALLTQGVGNFLLAAVDVHDMSCQGRKCIADVCHCRFAGLQHFSVLLLFRLKHLCNQTLHIRSRSCLRLQQHGILSLLGLADLRQQLLLELITLLSSLPVIGTCRGIDIGFLLRHKLADLLKALRMEGESLAHLFCELLLPRPLLFKALLHRVLRCNLCCNCSELLLNCLLNRFPRIELLLQVFRSSKADGLRLRRALVALSQCVTCGTHQARKKLLKRAGGAILWPLPVVIPAWRLCKGRIWRCAWQLQTDDFLRDFGTLRSDDSLRGFGALHNDGSVQLCLQLLVLDFPSAPLLSILFALRLPLFHHLPQLIFHSPVL
mmetsp:Transcript_129041/g.234447  ORF Transcript_129041/g.234447 Transcript_129041/m.234447 type:complete len:440 (-) Transcript_129041:356-1675(-)